MDKAMFSMIWGILFFLGAIGLVVRSEKKVNVFFPWMRGGTKTRDEFGLIETVSIEVRQVGHNNAHSQSYIFKLPFIEENETEYRVKGFLESVDQGRIPVQFDILKVVKGSDWTISFKVSFESELTGIEMVKAWIWVKADDCVLRDRRGYHMKSLQPTPKEWIQLYERALKSVKFINRAGSVKIISSEFPPFNIEQVWKHDVHAEYVSLWVMDPDGVTIEKGTIFEGSWLLKFRRN